MAKSDLEVAWVRHSLDLRPLIVLRHYAEFVLPISCKSSLIISLSSHSLAMSPSSMSLEILTGLVSALWDSTSIRKRVFGLCQRQCVPLELLPQDFDHTAV